MLSGTAVPAPGGSAGNSAGTKPAAQKTSFVDLAEAILAGQAAAPAPAPVRRRKAPKLSSSLSRVWGVDNLSMLDLERRNPVPPPNNGAVAGAGAAAGPAGAAALGVLQAHTAPGDNAEHDDENIDVEDELEDLQRYSLYESDLAYGLPHPDPLVQASSLANASLPPITYVPRLFTDPEVKARTIDSGALSKVQLEAVVYACQRHQKRLADGKTCAGFFVGDGAGVGKGRTIAGIIYENYLHGRRKALWISVSADLHVDAQRDLDDIGAPLNVFNIAKLPYRRIEEDEGVLFSTYSSLVAKKAKNANVGIATRLDQIVDWLGPDWDGCLIFDESHKAKNLIPAASTSKKKGGGETIDTIEDPGALSKRTDRILDAVNHGVLPEVKSKGATKTGLAVGALQERLRHARVVYVSATGVSEVRNMAYMSRMGLWGPGTHFPLGFKQFFEAVSKRGEGAMECLALDLKNMGAYVSRTLSYAGSSFEILKVETDPAVLDYDAAAKMWLDIKSLCENWADSATTGLTEKYRSVLFRMYWSAHQRFFRYLCVAAKVGSTVDLAQRALAEGKAVVIGLQNTGESSAKQRLADEPNCEELVSAPRESLVRLVLWYFGKCFVKRPEGMEDEELDLDLILDEVEDDEAGDHRITIGSDSEDGVRGKKGKIIRHARDDDSVTSGSTARRGVKSERVKNESDIDSEPKIKPEPGSDEDIDDFVVSDSVEESDSDPEVMPDDVDSDDPVPRCRRRTKSKPVQSAKAKGKQVVRDEPKPLPARRKLAPRTVRKSVPSYAEDSDADSEADEHPAPVPARAQRKKPVTVKSELKRKKPDPSIQGSKDKDESDGEIRGPIKKKMLIGDSDDEVSVRRPAAQPVQQAPVIPRRPVNLNRYLVPLYRLAGSKERVEAIPQFAALKEVLEKIEAINLPENALDQLVIALGGPSEVAELTGRKIRATISPSGTITYEKRYGPGTGLTLDNMNLKEKKAFMDGVKNVAIISDAASAGISLQADRRVPNQRRRVHITLELAWAADKTVQQLGRTHRSNQSSAPEYVLVVSDVAGENRFAASVSKRLASMGALTKGDRKASTGISLSQFNFDTRFGKVALEKTYSAIVGNRYDGSSTRHSQPEVLPPGKTKQEFFADVREWVEALEMHEKDADYSNVPKFLNRLLGLPLSLQNPLFSYFTQNLREVLIVFKKQNKFDRGIEPIGGLYETLSLAPGKPVRTVLTDPALGLSTKYYEIISDRGISFEVAQRILAENESPDPRDGFYSSRYDRGVEQYQLAIHVGHDMFKLYKPHIGEIFTLCHVEEMNKLYRKVKPAAMAEKWKKRYEFCKFNCIHKVSNGKCLTERNFGSCDIGVRLRRHHLFSGNAMGIWETVERAMLASKTNRLKIMRTSGENDQLKTIGLKVPDLAVGRVLEAFRKHDEDVAAGLPGIFGPRNPFNGLFSDDESGKEDEDEDMVFAKRDDDEPMGRNTVDGSAREDSDMDDYLDAELAEEDLI